MADVRLKPLQVWPQGERSPMDSLKVQAPAVEQQQ
jgi:hypothetical protein